MTKDSSQNSSFSVQQQKELSQTEREVLSLVSEHNLTNKQIAIRRQKSIRAVQKIIKSLKTKGAFNIVRKQVRFFEPTSEQANKSAKHLIRLHGQEWNIQIIWKDEIYDKLRKKSNTIKIDGNTIRLYENSLEIYSAEGMSFLADDVHKATSRSLEYWDSFFTRLEHEFKVILVKNRKDNIKLVNQHYSEINNELGQETEKKGIKIRIYANDDGKLWFLIDNSFNLHEVETVHPEKADLDMIRVKDFFNDLRDKEHLKLSELSEMQKENTLQLGYLMGLMDKNILKESDNYEKLLKIMEINSSQLNNLINLQKKEEQPINRELQEIRPKYIG